MSVYPTATSLCLPRCTRDVHGWILIGHVTSFWPPASSKVPSSISPAKFQLFSIANRVILTIVRSLLFLRVRKHLSHIQRYSWNRVSSDISSLFISFIGISSCLGSSGGEDSIRRHNTPDIYPGIASDWVGWRIIRRGWIFQACEGKIKPPFEILERHLWLVILWSMRYSAMSQLCSGTGPRKRKKWKLRREISMLRLPAACWTSASRYSYPYPMDISKSSDIISDEAHWAASWDGWDSFRVAMTTISLRKRKESRWRWGFQKQSGHWSFLMDHGE